MICRLPGLRCFLAIEVLFFLTLALTIEAAPGTSPLKAPGLNASKLQRGDILVVDPFSGAGPAIIRVSPVTGKQTVLAAGGIMKTPVGLAWDKKEIVVADRAVAGSGGLVRIQPQNGKQRLIAAGGMLRAPSGVIVGTSRNCFVVDADAFGGSGGVIEVDPRTGTQRMVSAGGLFVNPRAIGEGTDKSLYICDPDAQVAGMRSAIIRVDPRTGQQTPMSVGQNMVAPSGVAVDAAHNMLVTDLAALGGPYEDGPGAVFAFDGQGRQIMLAHGGYFQDPYAIAFDLSGGLLVADLNAFDFSGGIIHVDPTTGIQAIVSAGGLFGDPCGLVVLE